MTDGFLTAPVSAHSSLVLASVPRRGQPYRDVLNSLSDPINYAHVLDVREFENT